MIPHRHVIAARAMLPDIVAGLRAAVAFVVPFMLASEWSTPQLRYSALGGWLAALSDPGGTRSRRAGWLIVFALLGGTAFAVAEVASHSIVAAVIALTAASFAVSWLRAVDEASATLGTLVLMLVAIGISKQDGQPLVDGAYIALGAAWALVASTVVWPFWPHAPLRRAVARVYLELARYSEALLAADWPAGDVEWSDLAHECQGRVRTVLEEGRALALAMRSRRMGESAEGSTLRALLAIGEEQFPLLIALSEDLELQPARANQTLALTGHLQRRVAARLLRTTPEPDGNTAHPTPDEHSLEHRLQQRALDADGLSRKAGVAAQALEPLPPERNLWREIFSAASVRSVDFRHAVRVAFAACAAAIAGAAVTSDHSPWVTVATIVLLQPHVGATVQRAMQRVVGTVLGAGLSVLLVQYVKSPLILSIVMVPLCVAAVTTRPRSYRLFTLFLTPVFVMTADGGGGGRATAVLRIACTLLGALIAVAAATFVFPSWEGRRLPQVVRGTLAELQLYAQLVFDLCGKVRTPDDEQRATVLRREIGISLREGDVCLEHTLSEPLVSRQAAEQAMLMITAARRYSGALTTLYSHLLDPRVVVPLSAEVLQVRREHALAAFKGEATAPPITQALPQPLERDFLRLAGIATTLSFLVSSGVDQRVDEHLQNDRKEAL